MYFQLTIFSTNDGLIQMQPHCKLRKSMQLLSITVQRVLKNTHAHEVHIVIKIQRMSNIPEDSRPSPI